MQWGNPPSQLAHPTRSCSAGSSQTDSDQRWAEHAGRSVGDRVDGLKRLVKGPLERGRGCLKKHCYRAGCYWALEDHSFWPFLLEVGAVARGEHAQIGIGTPHVQYALPEPHLLLVLSSLCLTSLISPDSTCFLNDEICNFCKIM